MHSQFPKKNPSNLSDSNVDHIEKKAEVVISSKDVEMTSLPLTALTLNESEINFDELEDATKKLDIQSLFQSNGKLLNDAEIENLKKLKLNGYYHRKKSTVSDSENAKRLDSRFSIATQNGLDFFAVVRDSKNNKSAPLSSGSTSIVKEAQNLTTGAMIITKIIKPKNYADVAHMQADALNEQNALEEFGEAEAKMVTRISLKTGLPKFQLFITKAAGKELFGMTRARDGLPDDVSMLLTISANFLEQIKKMHDKQWLHRDIKIENTFVDPDTGKVTLIDKGFAVKMNEEGVALSELCYGTAGLRAPEIKRGRSFLYPYRYTKATDMYSAGFVLMNILLKRLDFFNEEYRVVQWYHSPGYTSFYTKSGHFTVNKNNTVLYTLSADLAIAIMKLCSPDPKERATVEEMSAMIAKEKELLPDPKKTPTNTFACTLK